MLIQHATAFIGFTIARPSGRIDLTDAQVILNYRRNDSRTSVSKDCTLISPVDGTCSLMLTPEDLSESGTYTYQLTVTFPDATVMKSELGSFYVEESIS